MDLKKKKNEGGGIPEWVVTYGDMMSLLLCFFILLVAYSEPKQDRFEKVMEAVREAFGYTGGSGAVPSDEDPAKSIIEKLDEVALYKEKIRKLSNADDPSVFGKETTVQNIREGLKFVVGGMLTFEPGSAELKPQAVVQLKRVATQIRGQNNMIEIRGHASGADLPPGSPYEDLEQLSYARSHAVMTVLTHGEKPIRSQRIRLVSCSDHEPLVTRVYGDDGRLVVNRRVEIIVTETLVQDYVNEPVETDLAVVPK